MYCLEEFVDTAFTGVEWKSEDHKECAKVLLLANSLVKTKDYLIECCNIINNIPADKLNTLTAGEANKMGLPVTIKES